MGRIKNKDTVLATKEDWDRISKYSPLKLNIGGNVKQCEPHANYRGWVTIDRDGGKNNPYGISVWMPCQFLLPDNSVDAALTEHFLEHMPPADALAISKETCRVLKPSACFRVAVPDMQHKRYGGRVFSNEAKLPKVRRLAAIKRPWIVHRSNWTVKTLSEMLQEAGFTVVEPQHWWENGIHHAKEIDWSRGYASRCPEHDKRNKPGAPYGNKTVTSLIVDAYK
jgi:predicted SAM-dependent methyltransferase